MYLPQGVNPISFYQECLKKGIKIKSRYKGITLRYQKNRNTISWAAQHNINGKTTLIGRFPFTFEGEIEANKAYLRHNSLIINQLLIN